MAESAGRDVNEQTPVVDARQGAAYGEALEAWLPSFIATLHPEGDPVALRSFPLKQYLQESGQFEIPVGERLRLLAIHIEEEVYSFAFDSYDKWLATERLYKEAIRIDPIDGVHHSSRALTSLHLSNVADDRQRKEMLAVAMQESAAAVRIDPSAHNLSIAGQCHYLVDVHQAMAFYLQALELDPSAAWPRLYLAYCLHDLERWSEAADAYQRVPKDKFTGRHRPWRMQSLNEQLADCLRRSGETVGAKQAFERILDRYEKEPHLAAPTDMRYLREACEEWPDFRPRIEAIERKCR